MDSHIPAAADPRRRLALVAAVYLGSFIATLDVSIVNVALPTLQRALSTDLAGLQWVIDIYALCLSAFMLSAGPLGDSYGRKRAWLAGVIVFTLGSAMCALAGNLPTLLAGRAVQGVAGALLIPGALSLLAHAFPEPASRARVIGGWSSFTALSLILGPMLGGLLVDHAGWQSIFLINLPIGVLTVGLGLWGIRETAHPEHAALDPVGQVLSVLWLGALTYGLIVAGEHGWGSVQAASALVAAAVGLVLFLVVEARVARPLLPLGLFRDARFSVTNFASFVLGFSSYASLFFFSLFLQQVQGWSPSDTGWRLVPQFVATGVVASQFGRLARRFDVHTLMVAGYTLIGGSMLLLTLFSADTPYAPMALLFLFLGAGAGLAVPATSTAVMASVPAQRSGMASATMNALRQAGMLIGIALLGTLMSTRATSLLADSLEHAGLSGARQAAVDAVSRHDLHALSSLDAGIAHELLATALAGGFHAAMACAGVAGLLAAGLLLSVRPRAAAVAARA
ncbi:MULTISPECIES: MFS transporter [Variovorax]|jgi:MFS transporter, DHA2 family, methylenomycin A resistance protein|uniref:MFS transporter n=1 Tax=Variovorax TaxID=34072 RepID=UPI0008686758|nr:MULTISPECIES: MFS transporter [Variovorax]MBN8753497.1 MFS transporter [Variovorax sp.]ODU15778.1 MAG: MFS transporter [Variovorax sp. SCN 67-85]ODV27547.1 MAG: MFS transporter [Variovorax sp. SCN 67-20]OJZ11433.1 MAG: MFS transporter [Variovorax sp. 67-131]UKI05922.1 MFS transporter [Variovorax paradoxus]